ncbi:hypothetical protein HYW76_03165 [Candidatus Pacearchaeota archaeon]|nr:hypothetical protein [Candidatus Pacearchaeota archaeon]
MNMERARKRYRKNNESLIEDFKSVASRRNWDKSVIERAIESLRQYSEVISQVYEQNNGSLEEMNCLEDISQGSIKIMEDLLRMGPEVLYEEEQIEEMFRKRREVLAGEDPEWKRKIRGYSENDLPDILEYMQDKNN